MDLFWATALPMLFGILMTSIASWLIARHAVQDAYYDGVQDGQKLETEHAVKQAVAADRMAIMRKMRDNGRRHVARPDAEPVRVHKAQVGPRRPEKPNK